MTDANQHDNSDEPSGEGVHSAQWEKPLSKILSPLEEFVHRQSTSGLLLMLTALIALVLANSPLSDVYQQVKAIYAGISLGDWQLKMSVLHWVNDGLMAFFFFIVGLELKREISVGELSNLKQAALPIACAIGGMVVPALIYVAFNAGTSSISGWGIPMATDIAFAIGILVLLADRVPKTLITFLVALAIVDDLGAVLVIAIFYTNTINLSWLLLAALILVLLVFLNLGGVRKILPYFLLAIVLWFAVLQSGVHATLAGVLGAFTVPSRPRYNPGKFSEYVSKLMKKFDDSYARKPNILLNDELHSVTQSLEESIHAVQPPLQRLEHIWHAPVSLLVIPVFALLNAGVPITLSSLQGAFSNPVMLGIEAGLLIGKFIGITGTAWLMLKFGIAKLPSGTRFSQIAGVSFLASIGFTMAIFIAELGFEENSEELLLAKTGILLASLSAGIIGYLWLYVSSEKHGMAS